MAEEGKNDDEAIAGASSNLINGVNSWPPARRTDLVDDDDEDEDNDLDENNSNNGV